MKSILIERVSNGWIVRPFSPCPEWAYGERVGMAVYTTLESLQKDLSRLLEIQQMVPETRTITPETVT